MKQIVLRCGCLLLWWTVFVSNHTVLAQPYCIDNLTHIVDLEQDLSSTEQEREYILCPNTTFAVGREVEGSIVGGQFPLSLRSNAHVKCGLTGVSENNCIINGTGRATYGIFLVPLFVYGDDFDINNILIRGVTISDFVSELQPPLVVPVVTAGVFGSVVFEDCIFSNNVVDTVILLEEFILTGEDRRRQLERPNAFDYYHPTTRIRKPPFASDQEEYRTLQTASLHVSFLSCLFESNDATVSTKPMIRFVAGDPDQVGDELSGMDATFFRNVFMENSNSGGSTITNREQFSSLIDFYSVGKLQMENNCFIDSPVGEDTIVVQQGATLETDANYISTLSTAGTTCDLVSIVSDEYEFLDCVVDNEEESSIAQECQSNAPTLAPTGGLVTTTVLDAIQSSGLDVSLFVRIMRASDDEFWDQTSSENGLAVTIFCPLDSAFTSSLTDAYVNDLIVNPSWSEHLDCLSRYHVALGTISSGQFVDSNTVQTLYNRITVTLGVDPLSVNGIPLLQDQMDISTSTGLLHFIEQAPLGLPCVVESIETQLLQSPDHSVFMGLIMTANLTFVLAEQRPLTIFAPTNDAFALVEPVILDYLVTNPIELTRILSFHMVADNVLLYEARDGGEVWTLAEDYVVIELEETEDDDDVFLIGDQAVVSVANVLAQNGVIHVVNRVVIPEGTITFPPTMSLEPSGTPISTFQPSSVAPSWQAGSPAIISPASSPVFAPAAALGMDERPASSIPSMAPTEVTASGASAYAATQSTIVMTILMVIL